MVVKPTFPLGKICLLALAIMTLSCLPIVGQESSNRNFIEIFENRVSQATSSNPFQTIDERVNEVCPFKEKPGAKVILREYGSIYAATDLVKSPDKCVFLNNHDLITFQSHLKVKSALIGTSVIVLQDEAMIALLQATEEAKALGITISPVDGTIAGKRIFLDTVKIWNRRFEPAMSFWQKKGSISVEEAKAVRGKDIFALIETVLAWEEKGFYFGPNAGISILSSSAPPGTSQHLSMLAIDIAEHANIELRRILAKNGWYQTVKNDLPHFTFLGIPETELPKRGLRYIVFSGRGYWVPNFE